MKVIEVKCPNCNASLTIEENKNNGVCEYCGTNFRIEDNTIKVQHIMAGQITQEQEFINAKTNLNKLKDYSASYNGYLSLSKRYVDNDEIWIGLLRSLTHDFTYKENNLNFKQEYQKYWKNYIALADKASIQKYNDQYQKYTEMKQTQTININNININNLEKNISTNEEPSKLIMLLVTIFLGHLGIHKFLKKQYIMGVVYFFTMGIFMIGWFIDVIKECIDFYNYKKVQKK